MAKQSSIPKKDADFLNLLKHLESKAPSQKVALNISTEDITSLASIRALFEGKLTAFNDASAVYDQTSTDKQATRAQVEGTLRGIMRRLKSATGYTEAIGQLLKIVGNEDSTDLNTSKPDLTAAVKAYGLELSFTKGKSDGVKLFSQRGSETEFSFLANDTVSPYVDNRPLLVAGKPEVRRYKAIYLDGDDVIGNYSDEVVMTAQP